MEALNPRGKGLLYPLLVLAAIAVIVFAGVGAASLLGWLPSADSAALSQGAAAGPPSESTGTKAPSESTGAKPTAPAAVPPKAQSQCADCGTVQSVTAYTVKGSSGGLGAVAGGVVGGLLGNQVGRGNGRTVATIAGAGGGAYLGDQIEKNMNQGTRYKVVVRLDDGNTRVFHEASARWQPGDRVKVADGRLAGLSTGPPGGG